MQRKLTDEELQSVLDARQHLRRVVNSGCHSINMAIVLDELDAIASHCTTDGKPYVEPQPEIGEGYRRATEEDANRRDLQFWSQTWLQWQSRDILIGHRLCEGHHYRVPVDRIPTDEDAKQRPTVMVCDNTGGGWLPRTLLHVCKNIVQPFLVISGDGFTTWKQARFPYPGELD
jgi:hypothetical protein